MDDATQLQPMSHRYLVVVKSEPQESEDTANIIDQHEVNTETSDKPLEDCLIQPKIEISDDEDLFHLQTKSEENSAFSSHYIDHQNVTCQTLEASVTEDVKNVIGDNITSATSIYTSEDYLIKQEPKSIGETDFFHIQIKPEVDASDVKDHNTEPSQDTYPINNSLVPTRDLLYSCELCSYQCNSKRNLVDHKLSHALKKYQVKKCYVFLTRCDSTEPSQVTDPLNNNLVPPRDLLYSCELCSYQGKSKQGLARHKRCVHSEKKHQCGQCDYRTQEKCKLVRHQLTHTSWFQCDHCVYSTKTKRYLTHHLRTHSSEERFQCNQCNYRCNNKRYLKSHMRSHMEKRSYACEVCTYKGKCNANLTKHMLTHSSEKRFQCNQCDYRCNNKRYIKNHMSLHMENRSYACKICTYKGKCNANLTKHMLTHSSEKRFQCSKCNYRCNIKQYLKIHMRSHMDNRSYACEICTYKGKCNANLTKHMLTHIWTKQYQCGQCGYRFDTKQSLKIHMLTHSTEKQFRCKKCDYRCESNQELDIHMRTHEVEGPHICEVCVLSCDSESSLTEHMLSHSSATTIQPGEDSIRKHERNIYAKIISDVPVKSEVETEVTSEDNEHHTEPSQNTDPLNNTLVPPRSLLYSCELCSYQVKYKNYLSKHRRRNHSSVYKFQCKLCVFSAKTLWELNMQHVCRKNKLERSFLCDICTLSCVSKSSLTQHMLCHSSATTIQPEVYFIRKQKRIIQAKIISDVPVQSEVETEVTGKNNHELIARSQDKDPLNNSLVPPRYFLYSCELCSYRGKYNHRLSEHNRRTHSSVYKFQCDLCVFSARTKSDLIVHCRKHKIKRSFLCDICTVSCVSSSSLTKHKLTHSVQLKSSACDINTNSNTNLEVSMSINAREPLYASELCPYTSASSSALARHKKIHTTKKYKCTECDYCTNFGWNYKTHLKTHSKEPLYACEVCPYSSANSSALAIHKECHTTITHPRTHAKTSLYTCDDCPFSSSFSSALARHKESHTKIKYTCTECDYCTNFSWNYKTHLRTHSKEPLYACDVCPFSSELSSALAIHKEIHTTKKYTCTECDYCTNFSRKFKTHLRTHSKEPLYACDVCPFSSELSSALARHKKWHSTQKYKCSQCDFKSNRQQELNNHMEMHVEKNPYACDMCSYVGGASSILRQHKRKYH